MIAGQKHAFCRLGGKTGRRGRMEATRLHGYSYRIENINSHKIATISHDIVQMSMDLQMYS